MKEITTPEHRTRIVPLRFIANNVFHPISMWFFHIGLKYNDKIEWDSEYKWHNRFTEAFGFRLYKLFDYPYEWWGTVYKLDMDALKESLEDIDMSGEAWDDYDKDGIPYWDYWWNEDPITGDAWRIVNKNGKM